MRLFRTHRQSARCSASSRKNDGATDPVTCLYPYARTLNRSDSGDLVHILVYDSIQKIPNSREESPPYVYLTDRAGLTDPGLIP